MTTTPATTKKADESNRAPQVPLEHVEWRVQGRARQTKQGPMAQFVAYTDARTVADLLDQWVGVGNWSDAQHGGGYESAQVAGKPAMWCRIAVRIDGEWIVKQDVGTASNMEAAKGLVSDAFKRAAVKWGIGRNLYNLPMIWAPVRTSPAYKDGKPMTTREGKPVLDGYPIPATMPAIKQALEAQGITDEYGKIMDAGPEDETTVLDVAEAPTAPAPSSSPAPATAPAPGPPAGGPAPDERKGQPVADAGWQRFASDLDTLSPDQRAQFDAWAQAGRHGVTRDTLTTTTMAKAVQTIRAIKRGQAPTTPPASAPPATPADPAVAAVEVRRELVARLDALPDGWGDEVGAALEEEAGVFGSWRTIIVETEPMDRDLTDWLTDQVELAEAEHAAGQAPAPHAVGAR